jgi:hypothetical protein
LTKAKNTRTGNNPGGLGFVTSKRNECSSGWISSLRWSIEAEESDHGDEYGRRIASRRSVAVCGGKGARGVFEG